MTEIVVRELKSHFFKRENLVDIKKNRKKYRYLCNCVV